MTNQLDFNRYRDQIGGCVLANRLTENKKWNVLLIEAGKVETTLQDVPVLAAYMQSTAFNWGFVSEPQAGSCFGKLKLY
jgi:choline dehydrogenase-like flavoprotein